MRDHISRDTLQCQLLPKMYKWSNNASLLSRFVTWASKKVQGLTIHAYRFVYIVTHSFNVM